MHALAERRLAGEAEDTLILLEHPPVFTAGRRWKPEHIVWTEERIAAAGAELRFIDRGGSLTFHGPGQLVGYPVAGSRAAAGRACGSSGDLEEVVIRAAADVGVELHRSDVQTGVWSGPRKVCAIGVRLMRMRVTLHGFALNCTTDLSWYDAIVPCGLAGEGVTSLSAARRTRDHRRGDGAARRPSVRGGLRPSPRGSWRRRLADRRRSIERPRRSGGAAT